MAAAHKGLSPSPIFGGGRLIEDAVPQGDPGATPAVGDIISNNVAGDEVYPDMPAGDLPEAGSRPLEAGQPGFGNDDAYGVDSGLVPPADVGGEPQAVPRKRTTLLDVIMGE